MIREPGRDRGFMLKESLGNVNASLMGHDGSGGGRKGEGEARGEAEILVCLEHTFVDKHYDVRSGVRRISSSRSSGQEKMTLN